MVDSLLNKGKTLAIFISLGKIAVLMELFVNIVNSLTTLSQIFLIIDLGISSYPTLLSFSDEITAILSLSVNSDVLILFKVLDLYLGGLPLPSFLNFLDRLLLLYISFFENINPICTKHHTLLQFTIEQVSQCLKCRKVYSLRI